MPGSVAYEQLDGPQKAAIVVLALGEERSASLLAGLALEEVKELSRAISALERVEAAVVERVLGEFEAELTAPFGVEGGVSAAEKLLARTLDQERARAIVEAIRGPTGRDVWEKLGNLDEQTLARYLETEHPQTTAFLLSRLAPTRAARVLARLSEPRAIDAIGRMLRLEPVPRDTVRALERTLSEQLEAELARTDRPDPYQTVAEIFNHFDRATETRLMGQLEQREKEAAERVKSLMFTFEDLARLDKAGIQLLIRNAGNARLSVALKGASEQLKELFFANMSERAAKILREEMQAMGPVRLREVEAAQQFLVAMAKELIATGEIFLAGGKDEELVE